MPVVIREIVSEVVLTAPAEAGAAPAAPAAPGGEDSVDEIVRRATERVLDVLRREWDR